LFASVTFRITTFFVSKLGLSLGPGGSPPPKVRPNGARILHVAVRGLEDEAQTMQH
jgi:hypothetical protein